mmetsp:Transcript_70029/g.130918  ORF Transcript_70029/g.130918 Transcript_70029/m.130918 type:complete len:274 (-) Transcript_70029:49-870(-)
MLSRRALLRSVALVGHVHNGTEILTGTCFRLQGGWFTIQHTLYSAQDVFIQSFCGKKIKCGSPRVLPGTDFLGESGAVDQIVELFPTDTADEAWGDSLQLATATQRQELREHLSEDLHEHVQLVGAEYGHGRRVPSQLRVLRPNPQCLTQESPQSSIMRITNVHCLRRGMSGGPFLIGGRVYGIIAEDVALVPDFVPVIKDSGSEGADIEDVDSSASMTTSEMASLTTASRIEHNLATMVLNLGHFSEKHAKVVLFPSEIAIIGVGMQHPLAL